MHDERLKTPSEKNLDVVIDSLFKYCTPHTRNILRISHHPSADNQHVCSTRSNNHMNEKKVNHVLHCPRRQRCRGALHYGP